MVAAPFETRNLTSAAFAPEGGVRRILTWIKAGLALLEEAGPGEFNCGIGTVSILRVWPRCASFRFYPSGTGWSRER